MSDAALIDHVDAPILVGDPEARVVHVNPAFVRSFGIDALHALGMPLAELFEGGAREAMLGAVASACQRGESARCRLRERGVGYEAVVSPIVRDGEGVGVVVLLQEEIVGSARLTAIRRELGPCIDEVEETLATLLEETGGRRNPGHRVRLEEALRSLDRLRKASQEIGDVLAGGRADGRREPYDPAALVRQVAEGIREEAARRGVELLLLAPLSLEGCVGDGPGVAMALRRMVEARIGAAETPARLTLAARRLEDGELPAILLSVTEKRATGAYDAPFEEPPGVREALAAQGALTSGYTDPRLGRTAVIRLPLVRG